jgi:hypothetical protein
MRVTVLGAAALMLSACAVLQPGGLTTGATLTAADAATSLAVGQELAMSLMTRAAPADTGQDPLVRMSLRHADGRVMGFEELNHAPMHVMAQAPGGPLAQTMGLFGEERPTLYGVREGDNSDAPFICGPDGPIALGYYEAADGTVQIVGLKQQFAFETRPDGVQEAVPYSPDQVCARLRFTKS